MAEEQPPGRPEPFVKANGSLRAVLFEIGRDLAELYRHLTSPSPTLCAPRRAEPNKCSFPFLQKPLATRWGPRISSSGGTGKPHPLSQVQHLGDRKSTRLNSSH